MPGLAPWLQPADPAKHFLDAYQTSARIAEANQRMAQQAQQAQQDFAQQQLAMEQRHAQQDRENEMERQRLEIAKSYHEQQIALGQQKLEEAKKMHEIATQATARRFQVQGQINQEVQNLVAGGMDSKQAHLQATFNHAAELGMTGNEYGTVAGHMQAPLPQVKWVPPDPQTKAPGYLLDSKGTPHISPDPEVKQRAVLSASKRKLEDQQAASDRASIKTWEPMAELARDDKVRKGLNDKIKEAKQRINSIAKKRGDDMPYPDAGTGAGSEWKDVPGGYKVRLKPTSDTTASLDTSHDDDQ